MFPCNYVCVCACVLHLCVSFLCVCVYVLLLCVCACLDLNMQKVKFDQWYTGLTDVNTVFVLSSQIQSLWLHLSLSLPLLPWGWQAHIMLYQLDVHVFGNVDYFILTTYTQCCHSSVAKQASHGYLLSHLLCNVFNNSNIVHVLLKGVQRLSGKWQMGTALSAKNV